jgi:glycine/D-amino acid oxidase-like deaminating enzyme
VNQNSGNYGNAFDATIYCAGAGMFARNDGSGSTLNIEQLEEGQSCNVNRKFPVKLVRGQSLELHAPTQTNESVNLSHARLCGKYISPLPLQSRILVGATHEFQTQPLSQEKVVAELKERTAPFFPWNSSLEVDRVTCGVRVQSARGRTGRRPIVGRLSQAEWIFTGLSSRGLLYHGIYGKLLADAILADDEQVLLDHCPDIFWWRGSEG